MGKSSQVRAGLTWFCFAVAALLLAALVATRWIAIDFQTGTPMAVTLDQGTLIVITGDESLPLSLEAQPHDPDQVAWQWWFASFPHSLLVPLWAPALILGAAALALRPRERTRTATQAHDPHPPGGRLATH